MGLVNAVQLVDYLTLKGMSIIEAHMLTSSIVQYCKEKNKSIANLKLIELMQFSDFFDRSIYEYIESPLEKIG